MEDYSENQANANQLLQGKKILSFPQDLGNSVINSESGLPNQFMMFKINTDESGSSLEGDTKSGPVLIPVQNQAGTGIGVGSVSSKNVASVSDSSLKFGQSAVDNTKWVVKRGLTSLNTAIILPMPNEHYVNTAVNYDNDYTPSGLTQAGDFFNNGMNSGGAGDLVKMVGASVGAGLMNKLKSQIDKDGDNRFSSQRDLLAANRLAINPKKEVMFNGFGFRTFTFMFSFAPKNNVESRIIRDIITTFRYYALPEIKESKLFFIFPAEFEISFIRGEADNPAIPRIATSVLQRINVNYSPGGGSWSSLPDGMPVKIDMMLEFMEIELIDRTRVANKNPITSGY